MKIRLYRPSDASALAEIFQRAVEEIGPVDYAADQVRVWAAAGPNARKIACRASDGRAIWVAEDGAGHPCGFIDLEGDGHIDLMYLRPDVAGTGVGQALYDALAADAKARSLIRLYTEASEAARRFFLKQGFVQVDRNDKRLEGIKIHNYRMEKRL